MLKQYYTNINNIKYNNSNIIKTINNIIIVIIITNILVTNKNSNKYDNSKN